MDLEKNKKYVLHAGEVHQEVVTYTEPYNGRKVFVVTRQGRTKLVERWELSEIPETRLSKIGKWVASSLLAFAIKEAFKLIKK